MIGLEQVGKMAAALGSSGEIVVITLTRRRRDDNGEVGWAASASGARFQGALDAAVAVSALGAELKRALESRLYSDEESLRQTKEKIAATRTALGLVDNEDLMHDGVCPKCGRINDDPDYEIEWNGEHAMRCDGGDVRVKRTVLPSRDSGAEK